MRSTIINTIFRKEILEIRRDQRMLYMLILLPVFLYPVLFTVMGRASADKKARFAEEQITLWLSEDLDQSNIYTMLQELQNTTIQLRNFTEEEVREAEYTIGVSTLPAGVGTTKPGVQIFSNQSKDLLVDRSNAVRAQLAVLGQQEIKQNLFMRNLPADLATPFPVEMVDVAPPAGVNRLLISFIPMMLLLFVFTGCIYISIDITAGEKERMTLQTLFTAPVETLEIVIGKFLAVWSVGLVSAFMNTIAFLLSIRLQAYMMAGAEGSTAFDVQLAPSTLAWFVLLVLLATLFIAAICLAIMLLANSYKESQTYVTPLMMLVLVPALLVNMGGAELTITNALIPVYNLCLAMVALLKGTAETLPLVLTAASSLVYGGAALWLASRIFSNENVVTGERFSWRQIF